MIATVVKKEKNEELKSEVKKGRLRLRSNALISSDSLSTRLSEIFELLGISDRLEQFRNMAEEISVRFHQKAYAGIESGTLYPSYCRMLLLQSRGH